MIQRYFAAALAALSAFSIQTAVAGVPVPIVGDKPVDPAKLRVDNPAVISTDGTWRFSLTHGAMVDGKYKSHSGVATASSSERPAADAIDGKSDTRWCAENADMPQWWQVDLGKEMPVDSVGIAWEFGDGKYDYKIETSPDGKAWKSAAEQTGGDATVTLPPLTTGRFVRITITSAVDANGGPRWASIREVTIGTDQNGQSVVWSPPNAADAGASHDDDFAATDFDDKDWNDLPVPSNWEVLGYSKPTYFGPDDAVGLYRKTVEIPADWAGKKILWHCDGCTDSAEVWVNGKRAGYHEGGFTAFDIDLGSLIEPGKKNLIAVRVCKTTPTYDLDTGDYWLLGGIHRESHLLAVPVDHIEDVTVTTKLDDQFKNATLSVTCNVAGVAGKRFEISTRLLNPDGSAFDRSQPSADEIQDALKTGATIGADGTAPAYKIEQGVTAPKLWSAEKPNLYYLLITLKSGDTTETVEQRFGFRQTDIKDGVLLFNGVPIKCCGTCRHEEWSALGHALTEHEWQTDIDMIKAANINAVRTSHYNHAERFLELCDEKGLYVLDEIPACWVSNKDPKLKDAFVQHAAETLARDKNKPCVLAWSCGNESGWGPNFKAMVDYVAATDPTRPRFVSEVKRSSDGNLSFNDYHYPGDNDLRKICTTPGPSVITEGPHIFYNIPHQQYDYGLNDLWGEALANQWDRVWPSKYLFGAFIWEWQDQGLADKYPDQGRNNPYNLRRENSKGIVTGYRVPKPEYYHVKMVYSPVVTDQREVKAQMLDGGMSSWPVTFRNRYAFTDLSELKCKWQALRTTSGDELVASGAMPMSCAPGASITVGIPYQENADTLRVSFTNAAGLEVYAVRLHVPGMPWPEPPPALKATDLVPSHDNKTVGVTTTAGVLQIERSTGIVSIRNGLAPRYFGPTLNLGEQRFDDGDFGNKNDLPWIQSKSAPVLKNPVVTGGMVDGNWLGSVTADVTLAEHPDQVLGTLTYNMTVHPDCQIDVDYHMKWTATDMQAWEFGLKILLPGGGDRFSWFRNGQWTEYPAGHVGADRGTATPKDKSFNATKRNTVWAWVGPEKGPGVVVLAADGALHTRCNWSDETGTTLLASSAVSVDRDFSSGYVDYTRITFKTGRTYSGSFKLRLTDGKPE
jgi:beta-galactosidase